MRNPREAWAAPSRVALRISLLYAAIATGWILVSDWLLGVPNLAPQAGLLWGAAKGLTFVAVTSVLLFLLLRTYLRQQKEFERRFSTLGENLPGMVYRCENDRNWTMLYVSRAAQSITGYPADDLVNSARVAYADLIHPEDRERVWEQVQRALREERPFVTEYRLRRRDGTLAWIWEQGRGVPDWSDKHRILLEGLMLDITELKHADASARETAERLENLGDNLPGGAIYRLHRDSGGAYRFTYASRGVEQILGISREHMLADARAAFELTEPPYDEIIRERNERSARDLSIVDMELPQRLPDGTRKWIAVRSMPYRSADGEVFWDGIVLDITALKRSEERLDHLAHYDALTDLPNRLLFNARLSASVHHAVRQDEMLAVLFLDLDRFKHINDSLGHEAGDQLLQQLARRLKSTLSAESIVARISGDEFAVLLENIDNAAAAGPVAQSLIAAFEQPFTVADHEVRVAASIGISLCPADGREAATLLRNSDAAMYRAKEEGGNAYRFYSAEMTAAAFEHVFLENALRSALNRDEFRLVYQPQVDVITGELLGVEALLRWHHPQEGLILPGRFIRIAEQTGLIRELGTWVLRTACAQGKRWLDAGFDFGLVAVNVAGRQLHDRDFGAGVERALADADLPAHCLDLEISEDFVMQRVDVAVEQLQTLRAQGVGIAIDDFGTGYSSLSHLKRLPIDKLKIDQAFVRDIPADPDDMAICTAVIAIGQSLGLSVVAEGVETEDQAAFLREQGCGIAQGYLFGRPMPPEDLERLFADTRRSVAHGPLS